MWVLKPPVSRSYFLYWAWRFHFHSTTDFLKSINNTKPLIQISQNSAQMSKPTHARTQAGTQGIQLVMLLWPVALVFKKKHTYTDLHSMALHVSIQPQGIRDNYNNKKLPQPLPSRPWYCQKYLSSSQNQQVTIIINITLFPEHVCTQIIYRQKLNEEC